jgi:hypothetical protein
MVLVFDSSSGAVSVSELDSNYPGDGWVLGIWWHFRWSGIIDHLGLMMDVATHSGWWLSMPSLSLLGSRNLAIEENS